MSKPATPSEGVPEAELGYNRMFWKYDQPAFKHWCTDCGIPFDSFTLLYSHKELWHGKPILKLSGITTVGTHPSEPHALRELARKEKPMSKPATPSEGVPEAELEELVDLIESAIDTHGPGGRTTKFIKLEIAAYAQQYADRLIGADEPTGRTAAQVYRNDFRAELRSRNQKKGQS